MTDEPTAPFPTADPAYEDGATEPIARPEDVTEGHEAPASDDAPAAEETAEEGTDADDAPTADKTGDSPTVDEAGDAPTAAEADEPAEADDAPSTGTSPTDSPADVEDANRGLVATDGLETAGPTEPVDVGRADVTDAWVAASTASSGAAATAAPGGSTAPTGPADPSHTGPAPQPYAAPQPSWTAPAEPVGPSAATPAQRLRVGTVVWGLVIAALGVGTLAWAAGADVDGQLALIILIGGAGAALLVGSLISGLRASRR